MTEDYLPYWLAGLYLRGVGPRTFFNWLEGFEDVKALFAATEQEYEAKGIPAQHWIKLREMNERQIESDLSWSRVSQQRIICFDDDEYPALLRQIADPPLVLFVKGNVEALVKIQIALVGSRRPTPMGSKHAESFARALVEAGMVVTSGLAMGVDAASHRGALLGEGITIGVAGTGLHHVYPASHFNLVKNIIEKNGAVISEFPLAMGARAQHFPRRNRIIAGMSLGVLVVESALRSGSLITARHALEQGRDVFAIPGSIHNPLARGCHHLIRQGAKLVESVSDILEELGWQGEKSTVVNPAPRASPVALTADQQQLLLQIEYEITPMDVILSRTGKTAGETAPLLLFLELNSYIQSVPGGYMRTNNKGDKPCLRY